MFKFGFSADDNEVEAVNLESKKSTISWIKSKEIKPAKSCIIDKLLEDCVINVIQLKDFCIKYISSSDIMLTLFKDLNDEESSSLLRAEQDHSDLLAGIYEGGLKIWECTYDVLNFIEEKEIDLIGKNVLDLGCGAGIIGILCTLKKARCCFQDYNEEVIRYVTLPNIAINNEKAIEESRFFSGDWYSFSSQLRKEPPEVEQKFDYIFTCETIYNPENYEKLHLVFKNLLKKQGIVYLAAKSYYFGVGGGLADFENYLKQQNEFSVESVWKTSNGLEREILEIKFKE